MKFRIILKEINDPFVNSPTYSKGYNNSAVIQSQLSLISKEETIMEYNNMDKDKDKNSTALYLKQALSKHINQQSDSIELFYKDNDDNCNLTHINSNKNNNNYNKICFIELNDSDSITNLQLNSNSNQLMKNKNTLNNSTIQRTIDDDIVVLYYKIISYTIQAKIDVYQKNINSLTQTVSLSCSILNLKHFLKDKFQIGDDIDTSMDASNQKIFSISFKNKTKKLKINQMANKEYNDRIKLIDIIKEYEDQKRMLFSFNDSMTLKFLLVLNTRESIKMGLNFNFNYFKNFSQISFENNPPVHRECSDGLNLFVYCRNSQCLLYNEMFVKCLGYGNVNVMNEVLRTRCPKCLCSSLIEARNLGMINAKWEYKGVLNGKKEGVFEGDGVTIISNKLYLFSEIKITNTFCKLIIKIKPHKANEDPNAADNKENDLINENESSLFDSVPLCFDEKIFESRIHESNMSKVSRVDMIINGINSQMHSYSQIDKQDDFNARNAKDNNDNVINVLSSQGNRDRYDYCLNKCLLNISENSPCYIF